MAWISASTIRSFRPRSSPIPLAVSEPLACAEGADALVLTTPWPQYRELQIADLARLMTGRVLIDPHRLLYGG